MPQDRPAGEFARSAGISRHVDPVRPAAKMTPYLVLLRGINVGGRNKIPMAALRTRLANLGFERVSTYIASGNVVLRSAEPAERVREQIEAALLDGFSLDDELIKVLVLNRDQLRVVIEDRPEGFGARPDKYHSDAIFMMNIAVEEALTAFTPGKALMKFGRVAASSTPSA